MWPWVALALIVIIIFVVWLCALNKYPTPPSEDLGGHLTVLDAMHRSDAVRPDRKFHHPPLYYLILDVLIHIFSLFTALKIAAAGFSTIIAIPFFFLARKVSKNDLVAIVTTVLFTFSESNSDMIGWGGIPNLFGVFFMLFSMYYFIQAVEEASWKKALVAGFFLSLTVGTHPLTSVYYIVALLTSFFVLVLVKAMPVRSTLKIFIPLFLIGFFGSLPYSYVYLFLFTNRVNVATASQFNWGSYPSYLRDSLLTLAREWYTLIIVIVIAFASFINLWKRHGSTRITKVILSFALAILVLSFLTIPSLWGRVFYFLYVPIFLGFSVLLSDYLKFIARLKFPRKILLAFLPIFIILTSVVTAYSRMIVSIDYYNILNEDAVQALDWIKQSTDSSAVMLTNYNGLAGWIEGYALRKAYSSRPLGYIVTSTEYQETIVANKILAGNDVIENSYLMVSDFFPAGYNNPGIYLNTPEGYGELVFLNDEFQSINISRTSFPEEVLTKNLFSGEAKATEVPVMTDEAVVCTHSYRWYFGEVNRTIELSKAPYVNVTYTMDFPQYSIREFQINLTAFSVTKLENYAVTNNVVSLDLLTPQSQDVRLKVAIVETTGEIDDVFFVPQESITHMPAVVFIINATGSNLYTKLQISFESSSYTNGSVEYANAYELLEALNIKYIILDKQRHEDLHRFTYERQRYEPVFENNRILILEVK